MKFVLAVVARVDRLIFPWNDPARQAEYDADPDDLIRSGYGW